MHMTLRLDTTARRIDVAARTLLVTSAGDSEELLAYDKLITGTGAVPVKPSIGGLGGPDALGPVDGVHLLHRIRSWAPWSMPDWPPAGSRS